MVTTQCFQVIRRSTLPLAGGPASGISAELSVQRILRSHLLQPLGSRVSWNMFQPSQRKVLLLNGHPMVKGYSFGAPSAPYFIHRTVPSRWSALPGSSFSAFRELHRSNSLVSVKELTTLKASNSGELKTQIVHADPAKHPPSVIEALYAVQWSSLFSSCRQRLTLENAVGFARKLPSSVAAGYTMVKDSREYELVQKTVITAWRLSVWIARSAFFWLCVFIESREYFYLRYYTLLGLEQTIGWLRVGLRFSFEMLRTMLMKK